MEGLRFISEQQPVRVRLLKPVEERVEAGGVVVEPTPAGGELKVPCWVAETLAELGYVEPLKLKVEEVRRAKLLERMERKPVKLPEAFYARIRGSREVEDLVKMRIWKIVKLACTLKVEPASLTLEEKQLFRTVQNAISQFLEALT